MGSTTSKLISIRSEISLRKQCNDVVLVGVTKFQPLEVVQEAIDSGLTDLAVNYAQEGETLRALLASKNIRWHFIGHIQSRKVKYLTEYQMIQSLDRLEVATSLNGRLKAEGKKIKALIEINLGEEDQKSGIQESELEIFLNDVNALNAIEIRGLMVLPPPLKNPEDRRPFFKKAKNLFDRFQATHSLDTLSMGTSDDYLVAVEEGSNMVRLGTTLFGKRNSK